MRKNINNKRLYESIMKDVARIIKKRLNEDSGYSEDINRGILEDFQYNKIKTLFKDAALKNSNIFYLIDASASFFLLSYNYDDLTKILKEFLNIEKEVEVPYSAGAFANETLSNIVTWDLETPQYEIIQNLYNVHKKSGGSYIIDNIMNVLQLKQSYFNEDSKLVVIADSDILSEDMEQFNDIPSKIKKNLIFIYSKKDSGKMLAIKALHNYGFINFLII